MASPLDEARQGPDHTGGDSTQVECKGGPAIQSLLPSKMVSALGSGTGDWEDHESRNGL